MKPVLVLALLLATSAAASAHVTLKTGQARVGQSYDAVLRVGHGCAGAPTTTLRVRIPEGVLAVKPKEKPGWSVQTKTGTYARTYELDGASLREGVTEVRWTGGDLPDGRHDEFAMTVVVAKELAGTKRLFFPVVQECTGGKVERWIEIPGAGKPDDDYASPAPGVTLIERD